MKSPKKPPFLSFKKYTSYPNGYPKTRFTLFALLACLGLGAFSHLHAQTVGTPVVVDGTTLVSTSGTTIATTGVTNHVVTIKGGGILLGADNWDLTAKGSSYGVYVYGTSSASLANSNITSEGTEAIGLESRSNFSGTNLTINGRGGLYIKGTSSANVVDSIITATTSNYYGIEVNGRSDFTGSGLTVSSAYQTVSLMGTSNMSLVSSTLKANSNQNVMFVGASSTFSGTGLTFLASEGAGASIVGMQVQGNSMVTLVDSTIRTNGNGMVFFTSTLAGTNLDIQSNNSLALRLNSQSTANLTDAKLASTSTGVSVYGVYVDYSVLNGTNMDISSAGGGAALFVADSSSVNLTGGSIINKGKGYAVEINNSIFNGSNLNISAVGDYVYGFAYYGGQKGGLTSSTITVTGTGGAVALVAESGFSGTNLVINALGENSYGVYMYGCILTGGTIYASDVASAAVAGGNGTITEMDILGDGTAAAVKSNYGQIVIQNSNLNVQGDLVRSQAFSEATVVLDTVQATNGGNVFTGRSTSDNGSYYAKGDDPAVSTNNLMVKNSALTGNIVASGLSENNITLSENSTLTGQALRVQAGLGAAQATGNITVAIDSSSKWALTQGASSVTSLASSGALDAGSGRTLQVEGDFAQTGNLTLTLDVGDKGAASALITVGGDITLGGGLTLAGNFGEALAVGSSPEGTMVLGALAAESLSLRDYFVLINNTGGDAVNGTFSEIHIGADAVSLSIVADTGGGGTFDYNGGTFLLTYAGDATSGATTGGHDVLLSVIVVPVPEPGTWAMLLGGAGMLACYLRARRRFSRES